MTRLGDDVVGNFSHGRRAAIGSTPVSISATSRPATRGVQLKADEGNLGVVYLGTQGMTLGTAPATDGFPLSAGEGLFLPIDDAAKIYAGSPAAGQVLHFVVV